MIEKLAHTVAGLELHEQVEHMLQMSGLIAHFQKEKGEKGRARVENLEELISAARQFEYDEEEDEGLDTLSAFLALAALEAGEGQAEPGEDCVQMMTLHSAKGLEFPLVFLSGMEEGLFPHQMSSSEPGRIEEERRLCYVGITRAMQQLYITYAENRRLHGKESYMQPSRFLREIPTEYLREVRLRSQSGPVAAYASGGARRFATEEPALSLGQRVSHAKFGDGIVVNYEGSGSHARVQVSFDDCGSKWLMLAYANLRAI